MSLGLHHRHRRRIRRSDTKGIATNAPRVALWLSRLLSVSAIADAFEGDEIDKPLLVAVGLPCRRKSRPTRRWLRKQAALRVVELSREPPKPSRFAAALDALVPALHLDPVEAEIVAFAFFASIDCGMVATLEKAVAAFAYLTHIDIKLLAVALDTDDAAIRHALRGAGTLVGGGVIEREGDTRQTGELPALHDKIRAAIECDVQDPREVMQRFLRPVQPSSLRRADFAHVGPLLDTAFRHVQHACQSGAVGVNVLLHGPPGTGKTELGRLLAAAANAASFEVTTEDEEGDEPTRMERLRDYQLGQRLLGSVGGGVVIFDEAEDVFGWSTAGTLGISTHRSGSKAFLNRALESNPVPTVWITNAAASMDPAILRRFDVVLHLDALTQATRVRIVRKSTRGAGLQRATVDKIGRDMRIQPADIARALKVSATHDDDGSRDAEVLALLDANVGTRQGVSQQGYRHDEQHFDISLLNSDFDVVALLDGLRRTGEGRICLFGPPGTGKTALVHHIGRQLGKPVILARASDLLSKWVGENEKNLAAMFARAKSEDAVLLLDEADSFLRDRRRAVRGWEVTQVNELLVQMEAFDGVFFCATNLQEDLDQASARRFDARVHLGPMTASACWTLFRRTVSAGGGSVRSRAFHALRPAVERLAGVCLGDFHAIRRRSRLVGRPLTGAVLLGWLRDEVAVRAPQARVVGFGRGRDVDHVRGSDPVWTV